MSNLSSFLVEPLEARIAPAAFVTYTDVDGDLVKITASKGPLDLTDLSLTGGMSGQLTKLNLTDANFDGAKIVFTVTKKPGGDGLAHVGFIDATGRDLDSVVVKGDLARIVVGDPGSTNDPGLNLLSVRSMGTLGTFTGSSSIASVITGALGTLKVARDFSYANFVTAGTIDSIFIGGDLYGSFNSNPIPASGLISASGAIGSITIRGDLHGGLQADTGGIVSQGNIGPVKIGGSLIGGSNARTGIIKAGGTLGAVTIGGGIIGGPAGDTARISAPGGIGLVKLGGGLVGGSGVNSGTIFSGAGIAGLQIRGSVAGGSGDNTGSIHADGDIGAVTIGGSLLGGSVPLGDSLSYAGSLTAGGAIKSIAIKGSIVASSIVHMSASGVNFTASISAGDSIGSLSVGGSIVGNYTQSVFIVARGQATKPVSGDDVAIGKVTVKGDVHFAQILAGFTYSSVPMAANADASIGSVTVGGDWTGSSLVAGAQDTGGAGFGVGDTLQTVGDTALIARIASIKIAGDLTGIPVSAGNTGFATQQFGTFKLGGRSIPFNPGKSNDAFFFDHTGNAALNEV
jgi:hypothetical protein